MNNQHLSQPQPHWLSRFLPTPGNIIFTLLAITLAFWAQSVGALPGASPTLAPQQASTDTIPYQGRLTNPDGNPLTGNYPMTFRLYDAPTGGTLLWEEQWNAGVEVADGLFNVMLGSQTAIAPSLFTDHDSLFLGIVVGGEEISERVQLGSVPFAMTSQRAFVLAAPDGDPANALIVDDEGRVGIGTTSPSSTLEVAGEVKISGGNPGAGKVLTSDASGVGQWKQTIIHGNVAPVANTSNSHGHSVSSGVSITLPAGTWQISGMGIIASSSSCPSHLSIINLSTDNIVRVTLTQWAESIWRIGNVTAYVAPTTTTTYELQVASRATCNSTIWTDSRFWELVAGGIAD